MRKLLTYFLITVPYLFLFGCQQSVSDRIDETIYRVNIDQESKDTTRIQKNNQYNIFDFKHIDKAPETTNIHSLKEVIKIYFSRWTFDDSYTVGVDIENNKIYVNPIINPSGLHARNGIVQIKNADRVLDILEEYEVQRWKSTFNDPNMYTDGSSWKLWLQYENGLVKKYRGSGMEDENTPDNFDDFSNDLTQFVEEGLDKANNQNIHLAPMY